MTEDKHSSSTLIRVLKEIFFLCAVFFAEVYLLKHFITIDSSIPVENVVIPSLCAFAVFSYVTAESAPRALSLQKKTLALNAVLLSTFFILNLKIRSFIPFLGWPVFFVSWLAAAVLALGSSFFVLVKPPSLYRKIKTYPVEAALGILVGLSQALYEFTRQNFWQFLASPTTSVVRGALRLGGIQTESPSPQAIVHPLFSAWIGPGCDGFEGIFFFIFVFCILAMLDWRKYSPRRLWMLFGGGILL